MSPVYQLFLISILSIFLPYASGSGAFAQDHETPLYRQMVISGGYSGSSVRLLGKTPDAVSRIGYVGMVRPSRFFWRQNQIGYSMGFYPVISFSYPRRDLDGQFGLAYGGGISPLGLYLNNPISQKLAFGFSVRSGIILLNRLFPTEASRRLNYSFDLSASLEWKITSLFSLATGYTFHHISNAQTGRENPGLDSNFISLSILVNPTSWQ